EEGAAQTMPGFWRLARYADVAAVLNDPRASARRPPPRLADLPPEMREPVRLLREHFARWIMMMDPPDHTRIRKLVGGAFTPRVVESLRGRIEGIVAELLAGVRDAGGMEVISTLAYPLPTRVIAELIGLPAEHAEQFKTWGSDIGDSLAGGPKAPDRVERQVRAASSLAAVQAYLEELI